MPWGDSAPFQRQSDLRAERVAEPEPELVRSVSEARRALLGACWAECLVPGMIMDDLKEQAEQPRLFGLLPHVFGAWVGS